MAIMGSESHNNSTRWGNCSGCKPIVPATRSELPVERRSRPLSMLRKPASTLADFGRDLRGDEVLAHIQHAIERNPRPIFGFFRHLDTIDHVAVGQVLQGPAEVLR